MIHKENVNVLAKKGANFAVNNSAFLHKKGCFRA